MHSLVRVCRDGVLRFTPPAVVLCAHGWGDCLTAANLLFALLPCDSDRPLETMLDEFKRLKDEYPDRILIASIMEVGHFSRPAHSSTSSYPA